MEPKAETVAEQVKTGEYFKEAIKWYRYKYVNPFSHRTYLFLMVVLVSTIFIAICCNIYSMYPTTLQVQYTIRSNTALDKTAKIIRADHISGTPQLSITDILVRNYILKRESYDYNGMKNQFEYIRNTSSRIAFSDFYKHMSIDNPSSPVLKYKKSILKKVNIISTEYNENYGAKIKYLATISNKSGEIIAKENYITNLNYEIDQINTNLVDGDKFNFIITKYETQLLGS